MPGKGHAIFKDYVGGLEYIRSCQELIRNGLFVLLGGYQCHVFLDWQFVEGEQWKSVCEALNGAGVQSIQARYDEMFAVKEEPKSDEYEKGMIKGTKKRAAKKPAKKGTAIKSKKSKNEKSTSRKKSTAQEKLD